MRSQGRIGLVGYAQRIVNVKPVGGSVKKAKIIKYNQLSSSKRWRCPDCDFKSDDYVDYKHHNCAYDKRLRAKVLGRPSIS